jgi:hypothetical protein
MWLILCFQLNLKEMMIFNSMFPNTDVILFFAVLGDQYYYCKGKVSISKSYLQNSIEWHNDIEDWFDLLDDEASRG